MPELEFSKAVELLTRERKVAAESIIAQALKVGVKEMVEKLILEKYLDNEISEREALSYVEPQKLTLARRQMEAVRKDIKWGLHGD